MSVLGLAGMLSAGAAALDAAPGAGAPRAAAAAGPSTPASFARSVLGSAPLPPGGQPTSDVETVVPTWMRTGPGQPAVSGYVDLHALYLYARPAATVLAAVRAALPAGAVIGTGSITGGADTLTARLTVTGPHEDQATLVYTVGPTVSPGGSELRVDAVTVWVPLRPPAERAPRTGVMTVTGYRHASDAQGATGAVSVTVHPRAARRIATVLNALPAGPRSMCMESVSMFTITVRARRGSPVTFRATTAGCTGTLEVTAGGHSFPPIIARGCELLRAVAATLPASAKATLGAARSCARTGATAVTSSP